MIQVPTNNSNFNICGVDALRMRQNAAVQTKIKEVCNFLKKFSIVLIAIEFILSINQYAFQMCVFFLKKKTVFMLNRLTN